MDKIAAFCKEPIHRISYEIEDEDSIPGIKFDRSDVQALLKVGEYESIVRIGYLEEGTAFGGEDRIRVIKEAD